MTRVDFDPDLERLGEALRASTTIDLAREERSARPSGAGRGRHADARVRARRARPRLLAGATGVVAVSAAAVALLVSAAGSPPAYAITRNGDGSVLVNINQSSSLPDVNRKLAAMRIHEKITIDMASGPASISGPVNCVPSPSGANLPGPPVKVLVGTNGTEVISSSNTGAGTWHMAACRLSGNNGSDNSGNTGSGNTGAG
jgi:hypothetical protein